jgi:hypothetical protein
VGSNRAGRATHIKEGIFALPSFFWRSRITAELSHVMVVDRLAKRANLKGIETQSDIAARKHLRKFGYQR